MMANSIRNQVYFSEKIHIGLSSAQKLYTVLNIGLHQMDLTWKEQIKHLQALMDVLCKCSSTIACMPDKGKPSYSGQYNEQMPYFFIYRGTGAVHEYCYFPNPYWPAYKDAGYNNQSHEVNRKIAYMRDSTSWLQHSFIADYFWNNRDDCGGKHREKRRRGDGSVEPSHGIWAIAEYQNHYWNSKAHRKMPTDHDIRHHDTQVVAASIEMLLESMNG
jgi:hypothetical protein